MHLSFGVTIGVIVALRILWKITDQNPEPEPGPARKEIMAVVGGIGLSGVLSLSVLERRREIGVMRAIGASSGKVARIFIGEGLTLGILSWVVALPLSIPSAYLLTQALGSVFENEIVYQFTPMGALGWLVIVIVLAIGASWFPAQSAIRVSVRESLAY